MSWLVFPPFIIMAVFTSSTSLGARPSRKRFERLVFGLLVKNNQGNYSNLQFTLLVLQWLQLGLIKLLDQLKIKLLSGVRVQALPMFSGRKEKVCATSLVRFPRS